MDAVIIFAIAACLLSAGVVYVVLQVRHFGVSQAVASISQEMLVVAIAQPGPPIAGIPKPPKMNKIFSGIFNAREMSYIVITILVFPTALFRAL